MAAASAVEPVQLVERIRVAYGERAEDVRVEDCEDGGVYAQAKAYGRDYRECEEGCAPESAQRIANILQQRFGQIDAALIAAFFSNGGGAAEFEVGAAPRFGGVHTGLQILTGLHFDVKLNFVVEVRLDPPTQEQSAHAKEQIADHADSSTRPIACANRAQLSLSTSSCFFPVAVNL